MARGWGLADSPLPRLPEICRQFGQATVGVSHIWIQLSKIGSGLPTMGSPKIRIAVAAKSLAG